MQLSEINLIAQQIEETWQGDPWYGRPIRQLLEPITNDEAYVQPAGQHSVAELVWHMVVWREFVLSRLQPQEGRDLKYFEANDWRTVDAEGPYTWEGGLSRLFQLQKELKAVLQNMDEARLEEQVAERPYNFRKLLYGIIHHDIYHLGQIAYVLKLVRAQSAPVF